MNRWFAELAIALRDWVRKELKDLEEGVSMLNREQIEAIEETFSFTMVFGEREVPIELNLPEFSELKQTALDLNEECCKLRVQVIMNKIESADAKTARMEIQVKYDKLRAENAKLRGTLEIVKNVLVSCGGFPETLGYINVALHEDKEKM